MGNREPLAGWTWENEVTRILPTGQMATFKVFISRENGNAWWECHEYGGPWPYDDRQFDRTDAAQIAAEDAARALVADMAAALGGSVTWADAQEVGGG